MKKTLLFTTIVLCFISFTALAQTLTPATVPSTTVGTTAVINFTYTSDVSCAVYAELRIANIDESGVITQDYSVGSNYVSGAFSSALPASATSSSGTVSVAVPSNAVPSANLPSGKTYSWVYKLTQGVGNFNDVGDGSSFQYTAATITASNNVVDTLTLNNPPLEITAGSTVTISVNYTCPASRLVKFGIAIYNANGFVSDLVGTGVDNLPATTTTPVTLNQDLVIPANATPSSELPAGQFYKVDTALFTPGYASYITGTSTNVTLNPALSTNDFYLNDLTVYPNPTTDKLSISDFSKIKTFEIYDITGKLVQKTKTILSNSINVSELNAGMYFLKLDGIKTIKFIKN